MKKVIYTVIIFIALSCSPESESTEDVRVQKIMNAIQPNLQIEGETSPEYTIEERLEMLGIPGISIAVVENGELAWARAYGLADISDYRPVTTETLFLAGSISKPVAALAALEMVEADIIELDENINNKLTSWQIPDNEFTVTEKVTLRRILNHSAGLTVWGFPGYDKGDTVPSVVEVLDGNGNTDSVRVYKEPGESWMYSGGGYTIMQLMMTDQEGKSFPEIMNDRVLVPLGMDQSTYENPLPEKYHSIAATGYRFNGNEVEGKWPIYPEMAAAGLWTTPSQLIKYAQAIHRIYLNDEDGVISKDLVLEMLTPGMNNHGLGPGISNDETWWGHGGADEGFRARLIAWKDYNNAIVVMVNSDNGSILNEVLLAITNEYGWPGMQADVRKVIALDASLVEQINGDWELEDIGTATMKYEGDHFVVTGSFLDEPVTLLPENDSTLFDKANGQRILLKKRNGILDSMVVRGIGGVKVRDE